MKQPRPITSIRDNSIKRIQLLGIEVERLEDGIECTVFIPNELLESFTDLMELENDLANK